MNALELFWLGWGLAALVMAAMWWQQLRSHNASLADVAWAGGVGAWRYSRHPWSATAPRR